MEPIWRNFLAVISWKHLPPVLSLLLALLELWLILLMHNQRLQSQPFKQRLMKYPLNYLPMMAWQYQLQLSRWFPAWRRAWIARWYSAAAGSITLLGIVDFFMAWLRLASIWQSYLKWWLALPQGLIWAHRYFRANLLAYVPNLIFLESSPRFLPRLHLWLSPI